MRRIANGTWKTYNTLEERNRRLLDLYTEASKAVKDELYALAEKYSKDGVLTLSEMHKQNRLTELNSKYEQIAMELGKHTEKMATGDMQDGFREVYRHTAAGLGSEDYAMPNKKLMEKLLNEPWRGDSFSGRLWKNQRKLAAGLNDILLTGLQQGKTVTEMAVSLHNFMGQGFNDCHRLVRTETMHYLNSATMQRYKDSDVQYVQIWAAQDERTCEVCGSYHGKVYPADKCPMLPFHANCRCTIIPCLEEKLTAAANEAIRNTNMPVSYNAKYDYTVNVDGWSKEVNQAVSDCAKKVAEAGTEDGNEHMYLIDAKTGEKMYYEKGASGEVGGTDFWKFMADHAGNNFMFVHNHNTDGYFSETDMRTLLREEQIHAMIAVRNDAITYIAEKGKEIPKSGYFDELFRGELDALSEKVRNGVISEADRNIKREEIIVDGLLNRFTKAGKLVEINGQGK